MILDIEMILMKKCGQIKQKISFPLVPSAKMRWGLFYDYGMIGQNSFSEIKR